MKIGIFGMGYVGTTSAAFLLDQGHEIVAVDCVSMKIDNLSIGKSPMIKEPGVDDILLEGHKKGKLKATTSIAEGTDGCDMVWICVGTPSDDYGGIDFSFIDNVIKDIGKALREVKNSPLIVIRSTCLPGTMDDRIKPLLEKYSGLIVGSDIDLIFHPEFLREGTALYDFNNPPKIIIGEFCSKSSDKILSIYEKIKAPCFKLDYKEAEMVKYCDNLFHALKITFANEVAMISHSVGIDSRNVAKIYCSDTKLNISDTYLYPGNPYGGSCLPKDLRAILKFASLNSLNLPMLKGILKSNEMQINNLISRILSYKPNTVGMVGIAFKEKTDDIRESPYVKIAKSLIGEGIKIKIYDESIRSNCLIGSNKKYFNESFKNIENLIISSLDDLSSVDLIIINHSVVNFDQVENWIKMGIEVMDLANIWGVDRFLSGYNGIYW
jgi:GDP-mannose 6-dehydrogenase